jgi:iron(III) transport system substrate-binding protein
MRRALTLLLLAVLAVACGGPPTATEDAPQAASEAATQGGGADPSGGAGALEEVYAEVEGLTGEERRARLVELAGEAGCDVGVYTSTNLDESGPVTEAFDEDTGVGVELYRASSSTVLQRVLQEADAGFVSADVVSLNGPEMTVLDREGLLLPLTSPVTEDIVEFGVFDNWAAVYLNVFVPAWNTDRVAPEDTPTTWEEVLAHDGALAMELGDFDWFATLVGWLVEERGMSEDEAVQLFRDAAVGATVVDGHTLMAELLAAGEFDVTTSSYQHRIPQLAETGAPIAWEPAVEPAIVRPNGIGIYRDTDCPAAALLYVEYSLTDAQELLIEFDRSPSSTAVTGSFPEDVETLTVDVEALLDERERWEDLYQEIVEQSQTPVVED